MAEQNAKAATETAQAIKALGEVGQRAWVTVTDIQIASAVPLQGAILVDTQVSNRGKTPALDVLINSRLYVTDKVPEVPEFKSFDKHDSLGVMASDVPNWLHNRIDPDDANIVSLYQKKSVLILCGKADYRDVFGSVRCTTWAYYFEPRQGRFVVSPSGSKLT